MIGYIISSIALLLFSYTQVDLNLTISRIGMWQEFQKAFQYIGYYQRPTGSAIYIAILCLYFYSYIRMLRYAKTMSYASMRTVLITMVAILVFSYPAAFSYDFFNYLFTAKTVIVYHQNPYAVTPLSFTGIDPWTNFMRWTHLSSAYTPLWIGLSLVPYIIGLGYFITVLFAMKFFIAGFYLLACWALYKITKSVFALAVFALHPLVLIESLVSGHNDIVMVAFVLLAIMFHKNWLLLALSVATKLMTIVLIPVFYLKKNAFWMLIAMVIGLGIVLLKREFLPWYWVWIIPFIALNFDKPKIIRASTIISFGLLLSYTPYLYFGDYSVASQLWKTLSIWVGIVFASLSLLLPDACAKQQTG